MSPETQEQINEIEHKVAAIYTSVEKTRKYMLVTVWVTVAVIVLPLIGLLFALPAMLDTFTEATTLMQF